MTDRDFSTISPSAKSIILMRGYTDIPFARQTAELISYPEEFKPDYENKDFMFWARTLHFESRYLSIEQLLKDILVKNILEISSGFSFRGLDKVSKDNCYYIDTDLPELIENKKSIVDKLKTNAIGTLELLALNALDEKEFNKTISHFPDGEIVIVNEGLLMYFDKSEKEKLCWIIHKVLEQRGGYWITSDIYLKTNIQSSKLDVDKNTKEFLEQHRIEENKFNSFDEAKEFFENNGFIIDKEADVEMSELSSMKHFSKFIKGFNNSGDSKANKMQATWRLKVAKL